MCPSAVHMKPFSKKENAFNVWDRLTHVHVRRGFFSRINLLSGEVRSVTTALEVVEEVQEEVQEIEDE